MSEQPPTSRHPGWTEPDLRSEQAAIDPDLPSSEPVPLTVHGAVALGGMLGALARYGLVRWFPVAAGFPWTTFAINISGSFALAVVVTVLLARRPHSVHLRPFLGIGFLGAYTTFSTFAVETDLLVDRGRVATAVTYVAASLAVGIAAVVAGMLVGRAVTSKTRAEVEPA